MKRFSIPENLRVKELLQLAIQTLGAPCMDYAPSVANTERKIIINKTTAILFRTLRTLDAEEHPGD